MSDAFLRYHPLVNFLYFALVFVFSMIIMHPVYFATVMILLAIPLTLFIRIRFPGDRRHYFISMLEKLDRIKV